MASLPSNRTVTKTRCRRDWCVIAALRYREKSGGNQGQPTQSAGDRDLSPKADRGSCRILNEPEIDSPGRSAELSCACGAVIYPTPTSDTQTAISDILLPL